MNAGAGARLTGIVPHPVGIIRLQGVRLNEAVAQRGILAPSALGRRQHRDARVRLVEALHFRGSESELRKAADGRSRADFL